MHEYNGILEQGRIRGRDQPIVDRDAHARLDPEKAQQVRQGVRGVIPSKQQYDASTPPRAATYPAAIFTALYQAAGVARSSSHTI